MSLHLTPDMLAAAYDLLRTTPPFRRWKLPAAEDVVFQVNYADYQGAHQQQLTGDRHHILTLSTHHIGTMNKMLFVLAHEVAHMRQRIQGTASAKVQHNADFWRLSRIICVHHCWDVKDFVVG